MTYLIIFAAFILDLIFGDPRWFPHPVRGIGWIIERGEAILRRIAKTPQHEKYAGVVLVVLVISLTYFITQLIILASFRISFYFGFGISAFIAYTTLAARDLARSANGVFYALNNNDLINARKKLSMIVGRDTENLDEQEISRAVVETVAENTSDGVIAPLFYLALGGPALAMAYKAVNTMDSMIGYKNQRYINFGWAAARLDDAANYIPARIAGVLICFAADLQRRLKPAATIVLRLFGLNSELRTPCTRDSTRKRGRKSQNSELYCSPWRIMLRDFRNHPSPNSGWPEAAMAGALGVRLGGPSTYGGQFSLKPSIMEEGSVPGKKSIEKSIWLMYCASLSAVIIACLTAAIINW